MKRNEILGEHKKGIKAVKYNKKPQDPATAHAKAKEKLKPVKPLEEGAVKELSMDLKSMSDAEFQSRYKITKAEARANMKKKDEGLEEMRDRRDAYQRDYDSSQTGFGRGHDHRGLEQELAHETNNYAVAIDGRTWKVFSSRNHAEAVARSLQNKGKKASVHETGAEPTAEATGDALGTVSSTTPDGQVSIKTTTGAEIKTDQSALMPGANGTVQMKPDAAGDTLKPGAKVVSTEDMSVPPTTDSSSPINGDEENVDLRRLSELAGLRK